MYIIIYNLNILIIYDNSSNFYFNKNFWYDYTFYIKSTLNSVFTLKNIVILFVNF